MMGDNNLTTIVSMLMVRFDRLEGKFLPRDASNSGVALVASQSQYMMLFN